MRIVCTVSGGLASGYVAMMALRDNPGAEVVLYFNDTGWEHDDLYRFLGDLEQVLRHPITTDSDGRNVEELAYHHSALPSNRVPFCSHELKAERLHRFVQDGDVIMFGIDATERHRAQRLAQRYRKLAYDRSINLTLRFPLIEQNVTRAQIDAWYASVGIRRPVLYDLGFKHNNCAGGCVRQGKREWAHLYRTMPEVFADRERVEREMSDYMGRTLSFMSSGLTLTALREQIDAQPTLELLGDDDYSTPECFGVCATQQ